MGWRAVSALAAAFILFFGTAGCTADAAKKKPVPVAVTHEALAPPPTPALTLQEAREALDDYLATDDVLRAGGALRMALELVRDGQSSLTAAAYHSAEDGPDRYRWGRPLLLVPRLTQAPYWFTAVMERTRRGGGERRTAVLTLVKRDDQGHWQLSFASLLYPEAEFPKVALDAEGYATALDSRDETIGVSPQLMAPLHATVAEEGKKGFSADLIAPGPHTTGYSSEIAERRRQARHDGLNYDSIFSATKSPVFALRTEDGGGLVLYELSRITTLAAKLPSAPWIDVPPEARWATEDRILAGELRITETHQYVSVVPPRETHEPARVIAYDGAVTRVTGK